MSKAPLNYLLANLEAAPENQDKSVTAIRSLEVKACLQRRGLIYLSLEGQVDKGMSQTT